MKSNTYYPLCGLFVLIFGLSSCSLDQNSPSKPDDWSLPEPFLKTDEHGSHSFSSFRDGSFNNLKLTDKIEFLEDSQAQSLFVESTCLNNGDQKFQQTWKVPYPRQLPIRSIMPASLIQKVHWPQSPVTCTFLFNVTNKNLSMHKFSLSSVKVLFDRGSQPLLGTLRKAFLIPATEKPWVNLNLVCETGSTIIRHRNSEALIAERLRKTLEENHRIHWLRISQQCRVFYKNEMDLITKTSEKFYLKMQGPYLSVTINRRPPQVVTLEKSSTFAKIEVRNLVNTSIIIRLPLKSRVNFVQWGYSKNYLMFRNKANGQLKLSPITRHDRVHNNHLLIKLQPREARVLPLNLKLNKKCIRRRRELKNSTHILKSFKAAGGWSYEAWPSLSKTPFPLMQEVQAQPLLSKELVSFNKREVFMKKRPGKMFRPRKVNGKIAALKCNSR